MQSLHDAERSLPAAGRDEVACLRSMASFAARTRCSRSQVVTRRRLFTLDRKHIAIPETWGGAEGAGGESGSSGGTIVTLGSEGGGTAERSCFGVWGPEARGSSSRRENNLANMRCRFTSPRGSDVEVSPLVVRARTVRTASSRLIPASYELDEGMQGAHAHPGAGDGGVFHEGPAQSRHSVLLSPVNDTPSPHLPRARPLRTACPSILSGSLDHDSQAYTWPDPIRCPRPPSRDRSDGRVGS